MHTNALAHRDIKPDNILRLKNGKFALMDFGVAINLENSDNYNKQEFEY